MNALRTLTSLGRALAERYRRQIAKEDHARLVARFADLDRQLGWPAAALPGITGGRESNDQREHLEQLWKLPAHRP